MALTARSPNAAKVKCAARMLGSHVGRGYCGTGRVKSRTRSREF